MAVFMAIGFQSSWAATSNADEQMSISLRFLRTPVESQANPTPSMNGGVHRQNEYAVTASGAVVPAQSFAVSPFNETKSRQIDGRRRAGIANLEQTTPKDIIKQIDVELATDPKPAAKSDDCGPSPFAPEDVRAFVVQSARRHGVDEALAVAVATVESDLDRNRNSPAGARGPMQLMPVTSAHLGVADPCEPIANIDAGVRHLRSLLEEFRNPILAVAAYNAGEASIYRYGGIPPFPETVNYVAKILNHRLGLRALPPVNVKASPSFYRALRVPEGGVIVPDKRREWVAGVMHF
ncbi:lytic transglycosylase domain-containing protein [Pseudaminobacter sp. NGMCC 1.201702]|uniref:lytic transglycosylase domain-containing protein n=1 Tax=Pseudaminobacter sp. NGMCC 1.201702 TaxID=3391825 RepID=UPI0039F12ACD